MSMRHRLTSAQQYQLTALCISRNKRFVNPHDSCITAKSVDANQVSYFITLIKLQNQQYPAA